MPEFLSSIISGTISGIVTGLIVGLYLYRFQKRRDLEERQNVSPHRLKKKLPRNILDYVQPGITLEKIKEYFGIPDNTYTTEQDFFMKDKDFLDINSYLFNFQNASVKVTSQDNLVVDTITIFVFGVTKKSNEIEAFPNLFEEEGRIILGKSTLTAEHLENITNHFGNRTNREIIAAVETYHGRFGNYLNYTYFSTFPKNFEDYEQTQDTKNLIGSTIDGFCISSISEFAPSISIYES